ncbi:MAG: hypothetical protein ACRC5T_06285 [Cetobacterium sp.]
MLKELDYMDEFVNEDEIIYKKIAKIRNKFLNLQKVYFEMIEGKKTNSNVSQELLDLIYNCATTLKQMQKTEVVDLEQELFKHGLKLIREEEVEQLPSKPRR